MTADIVSAFLAGAIAGINACTLYLWLRNRKLRAEHQRLISEISERRLLNDQLRRRLP